MCALDMPDAHGWKVHRHACSTLYTYMPIPTLPHACAQTFATCPLAICSLTHRCTPKHVFTLNHRCKNRVRTCRHTHLSPSTHRRVTYTQRHIQVSLKLTHRFNQQVFTERLITGEEGCQAPENETECVLQESAGFWGCHIKGWQTARLRQRDYCFLAILEAGLL